METTNPTLTQEITSLIKSGISKENIYAALLARGIAVDVITVVYDYAIASFKNVETPPVSINPSPLQKESDEGRTVKIIVTIGSLMIGAGIFTFVAANWKYMDPFIKVLLLLGSMMGCYVLGWFLEYKTRYDSLGKSIIFLAVLIYGASIFLIAQIFNIRANWPDGFMLWMIGVFILALAEKMDALRVLAIILAFLGAGGYAIISGNIFIVDSSFYSSNVLLLTSATALFIAGRRIRGRVNFSRITFY